MRLLYNPLKAAQAAAHLVQIHGGHINAMALVKLLYLADRKSLLESGYPITGAAMVSMPHGPVLSQVYDAIKWEEDNEWYQYISERNNHEVCLKIENPSTDELSEYELSILVDIHQAYGHLGPFELRDLTHELPEWEDPDGSSYPIDPRDILKAEGKSDHDIEITVHEAEEVYLFKRFLRKTLTKVA